MFNLYSSALLIPILRFIKTLNFYQDLAKKQSLATEYHTMRPPYPSDDGVGGHLINN